MPQLDGTGPEGSGSGTGRGQGPCCMADNWFCQRPMRGFWRFGQSNGRGVRFWGHQPMSAADQSETLDDRIAVLEEDLADLKKQRRSLK